MKNSLETDEIVKINCTNKYGNIDKIGNTLKLAKTDA